MQIKAEEQEDTDKLSIALNGKREACDPVGGITENHII